MERIHVQKHSELGYIRPAGKKIARVSKLDLYLLLEGDALFVEAVHPSRRYDSLVKRVMSLILVPDLRYTSAFTIAMVSVDSEYQGFGIAPKVYRAVLKALPKLLLRAGTTQSPGGRYIWYSLSKFSDINLYAMTSSGRYHDVIPDDVERELALEHAEIYDNAHAEYSIFACAA